MSLNEIPREILEFNSSEILEGIGEGIPIGTTGGISERISKEVTEIIPGNRP